MLFDLGLSSFQLADRERGFGFRTGGPLDMRFDTSRGVPAAELLATLDADELTALFRRYGEEPTARRIARAIVDARETAPIATAEELAALVERVSPPNPRMRRRIHPATRVFQALRIAVNEELDALEDGLAAAVDLLRPGGRLVVLCYHSLEDRIVKRFLDAERRGCICPPELRSASAAGTAPAPRHPAVADPDRRRDRRQPTRPERAPAGRRAPRRLTEHERRTPDPIADAPTPATRRHRHEPAPAHGRRSPVSKRHQSSRRKTYGRRQHEVHERRQRDHQPEPMELGLDDVGPAAMATRFSFLDPRTPRLRFAIGD